MNIRASIIILLAFLSNVSSFSQEIKPARFKKFHAASTVYVIDHEFFDANIIGYDDQEIKLLDFIKEVWRDKEFVRMSLEEYDLMDNVGNSFYMRYNAASLSASDGSYYNENIALQIAMGKAGSMIYKYLYEIQLEEPDVSDLPYHSKNCIYAVEALKYMIDHYEDKSKREKYLFKQVGIEDFLSSKTLYINKNHLLEKLQSEEAISAIYPYKFKFATDEEIVQAWNERNEDALIMKYISGGELESIAVYDLESGQILTRSYPSPYVNGAWGEIQKAFFKKMF